MSRPSPAPPRQRAVTIRRLGAVLLVAMCVGYAPLAFEFTGRLYSDDAPELWEETFARTTDTGFAQGPRSAHAEQTEAYRAQRGWMTLHTSMGATALFLGFWQFSDRLRRRRPRLHRKMGKAYVGAGLVSMVGSAGFLVSAARDDIDIYSGPPFAAGLWGLWGVTVAALGLSVIFIRAGDVRRHSEFMALSYAGILTAPLLRVGWIAISRGSSGLDQWDANLAYTMSLLPQTVLLAALWRSYRTQATEIRFPPAAGSGIAPRMLHGLALFGIAALANDVVRLGAPRLTPPRLFPEFGLAEVGGLAFAAYATGSAVAMLAGVSLLRTVLQAPHAVTPALAVLRAYLGGVVLGSVGLVGLVASAGDRMLGGIASVYYWGALVPFWCLTTGLMVHALTRKHAGRVQEWTVHSVAMSFQSAVFHLAYLGFGLFAFGSPTNRLYTAAIISFAGVLITAYVLVAAFGGHRAAVSRTSSERREPASL